MGMAATMQPPALSTAAAQNFEQPFDESEDKAAREQLDNAQIEIIFEIERTVAEIRRSNYRRVALQFPDAMLQHAPRVYRALQSGLGISSFSKASIKQTDTPDSDKVDDDRLDQPLSSPVKSVRHTKQYIDNATNSEVSTKLFILGDTSYGSCCVDEIAAEHADADVVVHYGRACLSPTSKLPVIHVFTKQPFLDAVPIAEEIGREYKHELELTGSQFVIMSDIIYEHKLVDVIQALKERGHHKFVAVKSVADLTSPIPNRAIPDHVNTKPLDLKTCHLIHLGEPNPALLLTLSSRVASICTVSCSSAGATHQIVSGRASTARALTRRYALVTSCSSASVFGILINTLSVKNHLQIVEYVKAQIQRAGKSSYTFVVGKINAAKVANFAEIDAWVVIGCWESSLLESKDFWKPLLTPFELDLALQEDDTRLWTGQWTSDYQAILNDAARRENNQPETVRATPCINDSTSVICEESSSDMNLDSEDDLPESLPPAFDLRAGKYRPHAGTTCNTPSSSIRGDSSSSFNAVIKRHPGHLISIGNIASPGADHLKNGRTWQGLGSDFDIAYEESGGSVEQGRKGIARGYDQEV